MTEAKTRRSLEDFHLKTPDRDFWVFGYGSLMWNPGFAHLRVAPATHVGHTRAFAMWSVRHRGTPQRPGLVLTLCPGGTCTGRAFLVDGADAAEVCDYLLDREIGTYAYRPAFIDIEVEGEAVQALTFLPTPDAPQFAPDLTLGEQAEAIASAVGGMGPNPEYLRNTIAEMQALGLSTTEFEALEAEVLRLRTLHG